MLQNYETIVSNHLQINIDSIISTDNTDFLHSHSCYSLTRLHYYLCISLSSEENHISPRDMFWSLTFFWAPKQCVTTCQSPLKIAKCLSLAAEVMLRIKLRWGRYSMSKENIFQNLLFHAYINLTYSYDWFWIRTIIWTDNVSAAVCKLPASNVMWLIIYF